MDTHATSGRIPVEATVPSTTPSLQSAETEAGSLRGREFRDITSAVKGDASPILDSANAAMINTAEKADRAWYKNPKNLLGIGAIIGGGVIASATVIGGITAATFLTGGLLLPAILMTAIVAGATLGTGMMMGGAAYLVLHSDSDKKAKEGQSPTPTESTPNTTPSNLSVQQEGVEEEDKEEEVADTSQSPTKIASGGIFTAEEMEAKIEIEEELEMTTETTETISTFKREETEAKITINTETTETTETKKTRPPLEIVEPSPPRETEQVKTFTPETREPAKEKVPAETYTPTPKKPITIDFGDAIEISDEELEELHNDPATTEFLEEIGLPTNQPIDFSKPQPTVDTFEFGPAEYEENSSPADLAKTDRERELAALNAQLKDIAEEEAFLDAQLEDITRQEDQLRAQMENTNPIETPSQEIPKTSPERSKFKPTQGG